MGVTYISRTSKQRKVISVVTAVVGQVYFMVCYDQFMNMNFIKPNFLVKVMTEKGLEDSLGFVETKIDVIGFVHIIILHMLVLLECIISKVERERERWMTIW